MKPAAFLFDLDGTLIASELPWARAMSAWLADRGQSATVEQLAPMISGRSWRDIDAVLHATFPGLGPSTPDEDALTLHPYYDRQVADPSVLVVPSAVAFYRKAAEVAPCAVVSGSPRADVQLMIGVCGLTDVTQFVLGCEDYAHGKPAPDGYLAAAERLGVPPAECVVVEDAEPGVKAACAAGMRVIGARGPAMVRQNLEGCTWVVDDLSEFNLARI